ncbi:MAG: hypothetical protein HZB26_02685 [Candidatus Hydrogenedentes bacterium]|nr:hypothetical protein [Candidatus Hydrogenedentota bacterium]
MLALTSTAAPDMIVNGTHPVWCLQDGTTTATPQYRVLCRNCESLQERAYPPRYCLHCGIELDAPIAIASEADRPHTHSLDHQRN